MPREAVYPKIPQGMLSRWSDKFMVCSGKQARARDKRSVSGHHRMLRNSSGLKWSDKYGQSAVRTKFLHFHASPSVRVPVSAKMKRETVF